MNSKEKEKTANMCRACSNYFITHDHKTPYGCRALGFKSKKNPALVVFESSGLACQLFTPKTSAPSGEPGGIVA